MPKSHPTDDDDLPSMISAADLCAKKFEPEVPAVIEDGQVKLLHHDRKFVYEIELSRIRTKDAILQWARHLCEKEWMDTVSLTIFIDTVAEHQRLDVFKPHY